NDVKLSFNDVVPVIDVIRKQESFEGLRKGFNLWSLSKTDRSNFLGISSVWLRNRFNQTEHISELDFKKSTESESNYKLISSNSYPEREQEIIYLKNYIPLPYNKSDKDNLVGKLKESKPLDNNERTIVADALSRNYAEPTMNKNKLDLIINNCFEDKAEVYANYLFSTSDISKSEKPLFYKGNEVEYETIQVNLESASKIQIQSLSSKYDFYRAAIEFFGPENIDNADVVYNRDFTQEGIWQPTLNIQLIFNSKFQPDFSQWTYFTAICRSRCLYADVAMNFSYEIKS
ncbi:MAG TPA: hypothetical protein PKN63_09525, partial [Chitinophagales bacterium]|nr:hypothetical protein [Chitinophagales bacterium]